MEVFNVDSLVVDVARNGEVDGGGLVQVAQAVVFPLDGQLEGVGLAFLGEDFLEDGDIVEGGGVEGDAQESVRGW